MFEEINKLKDEINKLSQRLEIVSQELYNHQHRGYDRSLPLPTRVQAGATPGGSNTQVQFNDGGALGGDISLTWDKTNDILYVPYIQGQDSTGGLILISPNGESATVAGGALTISAGTGNGSANGGDVNINSGSAGSSGDGGSTIIQAGAGATAGAGGYVGIYAGSGGSSNGPPGDIFLVPGKYDADKYSGSVYVNLTNTSGGQGYFILSNTGIESNNISYRYLHYIQTTNATTTTLSNITTLAVSKSILVEARIVAKRTGGSSGTDGDSAMYVRRAGFKRDSTNPSAAVGAVQDVFTVEDQAGWDATIALSTNDVIVQVTGAANNNITWHAEIFFTLC